jgi:hypothetical protein
MTSIGWSFVENTAQLLERNQREAVLGDLLEAGEGALKSLGGILSLVVRQQLSLWRNWSPWVAAFAVSLPSSFLLMGVSLSVSRAWHDGVGFAAQLSQLLLLIGWSWSCGYLVGVLSRRTVWISAFLCCSPCLFCLARFRVPHLSRFSLVLFLLPAIWGGLQGLRKIRLSLPALLFLALTLTSFAIARHQSWILIATLSWPAWYLAASARSARTA